MALSNLLHKSLRCHVSTLDALHIRYDGVIPPSLRAAALASDRPAGISRERHLCREAMSDLKSSLRFMRYAVDRGDAEGSEAWKRRAVRQLGDWKAHRARELASRT